MRLLQCILLVSVFTLGHAWAADSARCLASLRTVGGLTPRGLGHAEFRIEEDGTLVWYDQQRDETLPIGEKAGLPSGFNGWSRTTVTAEDLAALKQAVGAIDHESIVLDPTRQAPSASDGGDATLEVASPKGPRSIPLWQLKSPESLPVVGLMNALESKYARSGATTPTVVATPNPSPDR